MAAVGRQQPPCAQQAYVIKLEKRISITTNSTSIYVGPQIGMNSKPIMGLPDLEY